jgi:hypothetical protein
VLTTERFRAARKTTIGLGVVLFVASMAMCHFGTEHDIGNIPQDVRASMSDTDWVGSEWAIRSVLLDIVALSLVAIGLLLWIFERRGSKATQ